MGFPRLILLACEHGEDESEAGRAARVVLWAMLGPEGTLLCQVREALGPC